MARYISDDRIESAPKLPTNRPNTRREQWAYCHHLYHDLKSPEELKVFAREAWVWSYIQFRLRGWEKQPDWAEGDPVILEAVPTRNVFTPGEGHWQRWEKEIYRCLDVVAASQRA